MNKEKKELLVSIYGLFKSVFILWVMVMAAYWLIIAKDHENFVEAVLLIWLIRSNHE